MGLVGLLLDDVYVFSVCMCVCVCLKRVFGMKDDNACVVVRSETRDSFGWISKPRSDDATSVKAHTIATLQHRRSTSVSFFS